MTKFVSVVTVTQQPVHDADIEGDDDVESGGGLESGHQAPMWIVRRTPTELSTSAHRLHHSCSALLQLTKHWARGI